MRQVRGHGQHPVVVQGIHLVDHGAAGPPQRRDALHWLACAAGQGGEDHPAVLVERRKARRWPRLLGPGNGVGRDKVHALGHVRLNIGNHRTLGGADVGDDAARREMRPDLLGQRGVGPYGGAQQHAICPDHGLGRVVGDAVSQPKFEDLGAVFRRTGHTDHTPGQALLPDVQRQRGADQPDADDDNGIEQRLFGCSAVHAPAPSLPIKRSSAPKMKSMSASVPMVIRRQLASP